VTTYTAVLPFVYKPYRDRFMKRCKLDVFEVDNTTTNRGVMRSHNLGIDEMKRAGSEWLVIMSAALRFDQDTGGRDFIEQLAQHEGHHVIEAAGVYGWHLIAFHCDTIERIGRWDANFSPYGFDDIDLSVRYQLAYQKTGQLWDKVPVKVADTGMAHSIKLANVQADAAPLIEYFRAKWGRHPGSWQEPTYEHPFNDPGNPVQFWPAVEDDSWDR
jgi:hypothetical protein